MSKHRQRVALVVLAASLAVLGGAAAAAAAPVVYGARAMAMGGAFTAAVDDASAFYWNPAAIGLSSLSVSASGFAQGIDGLARLQELLDQEAAEFLQWEGAESAAVGALGAANFGSLAVGGVAVGELFITGTASQKSGSVEALGSYGAGAAFDALGRDSLAVRAGVAARWITGERREFSVEDATPAPIVKDVGWRASGYALDAGMLVRVTEMTTLALVVRNLVSQVTWTAPGHDAVTEQAPVEVRAGVALRPPLLGATIAAELGPDGELRYGVEKRMLLGLLDVRAGQLHADGKTWTTAGLGLSFGPLHADAAVSTPDFKEFSFAVEASLRF